MPDTGDDLCRVTLIAPRVRLDVALPAAQSLASLLPTLLWHSGEQLADEGVPHGGWAVQRAGEPPLDTAATVAALGIRDGDILHLRPRQEALPAAVFDDAVDAIATALREQARRWQPGLTRGAALVAAGAALLAGAAALAGLTAPRPVVAAAAGVAAAVILIAAGAVSRALGDAVAGTVLGAGALPFAFLAGLHAVPPGTGQHTVTVPAFLVGCTGFLVAAAVAAALVGDPGALLTGAVAAGFVAVGCSLLALGTSAAGAAAAGVSAVLALFPAIAPLAYRMAGLPRPEVAATTEELRQRSKPVDAADITRRALAADQIVAALVAATGAVAVAGMAIMLGGGGWGAAVLAAVASGLLLLRARLFAGVTPRAWLLGSGLAGTGLLAVLAVPRFGAAGGLGVIVGLGAAAAAAISVARAPQRRVAPSLRRATDLLELLGTIATVPLALQVLHVYSLVRSLGG